MSRYLHITRFLFIGSVMILSVALPALCLAQAQGKSTQQRVLTGGVSQSHWETTHSQPSCTVCQANTVIFKDIDTGTPIKDATITIPDWGYQAQTDANGRIGIPTDVMRTTPKARAVIGNIQQHGYIPESFLIHPTPFLQGHAVEFAAPRRKQLIARRIVLDNAIHHLGDGAFVSRSSGAHQFQAPTEGPMYRLFFQYQHTNTRPAILHIGAITGLDTQAAHAIEHTRVNTYGSPLQIWLNDTQVGSITLNGQDIALHIPPQAFNSNGSQQLKIIAGENQLKTDVDDMEFMTLWLAVD